MYDIRRGAELLERLGSTRDGTRSGTSDQGASSGRGSSADGETRTITLGSLPRNVSELEAELKRHERSPFTTAALILRRRHA